VERQFHRGDRRNARCAQSQAPETGCRKDGRQTPFSTRHRARNSLRPARRRRSMGPGPRSRQPLASPRALIDQRRACAPGRSGRPGGHSEGPNTRSHPELGRENPQRRWYCASRRGRVGRRQARQNAPRSPLAPHPQSGRSGPATPTQIPGDPRPGNNAGWSSPVARQAHNLKVTGSNPVPATTDSSDPDPPGPGSFVLRSVPSAKAIKRARSP
jgi:hypothetical protein